jgi:HEAT repeat protein
MKIKLLSIAVAAFAAALISPADVLSPTEEIKLARHIIQEGAEAKDPNVRIQAITATSMIGSNETVIKQLEDFLQDKDVQVRIAAINALSDLKSPTSTGALENSLKDSVPEVTFAAAQALYTLHNPAGQQALLEVYDKKIKASSGIIPKQSRKMLRNFHSFQTAAMFVVSEGAGAVPIPGVGAGVAALTELLSDPELSPRANVVLLLGRQQTDSALDLLKRGLTDSDWSVRAAATQMIAHTARMQLQKNLVPLFSDKKEKVRFRAAGAYIHLYLKTAS